MNISFDEISSKARVWIYQADRSLTDEEIISIENSGKEFTNKWEAHGKALCASIRVFHHQFIVIAVDEDYNLTTGCSIDSSVGFIREIAKNLTIDLFDRTKVAFLLNDKVYLTPLKTIKSKVEEGTITEETFTFNNMVSDKAAFENKWLTEAKNTWLARYF